MTDRRSVQIDAIEALWRRRRARKMAEIALSMPPNATSAEVLDALGRAFDEGAQASEIRHTNAAYLAE